MPVTEVLWHGALMGVAWLVLLPAGILVARFFKVRTRQGYPFVVDDRFWWDTHRTLQVAGAATAAAGAFVAWKSMGRTIDWSTPHVRLGLLALLSLLVQIVSPALRGTKGGPTDPHADPYAPETWRGDHFDMTRRRLAFEFVHKKLGYAGMAVAVCAVWTGIEVAGLDPSWRLFPVGAAVVFAGLFAWFTITGRRIDTWQAIWGPYKP